MSVEIPAITTLLRSLRLLPRGTALLWRLKGDAEVEASNHRAALRSYRQAVALEPSETSLLKRLAEVLSTVGDLSEAVQAWRSIVRIESENGSAHLRLADVLQQEGRTREALENVQRAITLGSWEYGDDEQELDAYVLKGDLLRQLDDHEEAAKAYHEAGVRRGRREEYAAAAELYRRAKSCDSNYTPSYWGLSDALRMLGDAQETHEGEHLIQEALQVWDAGTKVGLPDPDHSWSYISRGLIGERMALSRGADRWDRTWEAIAYAERALLLRERDALRWAFLGRFYRSVNAEPSSLHATGKALEYGPNSLAALEERAAILANIGDFDGLKRSSTGVGNWGLARGQTA